MLVASGSPAWPGTCGLPVCLAGGRACATAGPARCDCSCWLHGGHEQCPAPCGPMAGTSCRGSRQQAPPTCACAAQDITCGGSSSVASHQRKGGDACRWSPLSAGIPQTPRRGSKQGSMACGSAVIWHKPCTRCAAQLPSLHAANAPQAAAQECKPSPCRQAASMMAKGSPRAAQGSGSDFVTGPEPASHRTASYTLPGLWAAGTCSACAR